MANESNIAVKESKPRPIRSVKDDPNYEERVRKGKLRMANGDLKFNNEADKRDYERRVASNPNNVPGLPAFFPPLTLKQMPVTHPAIACVDCGGCCIASDRYICPCCGKDNS